MNADHRSASLDLVYRTLNRELPIGALEALLSAMGETDTAVEVESAAIALDANVFLRISSHRNSSDIIDYLGGRHAAPLILPGQAVQEFWNNQLQAVATVAKGLKSDFEKLRRKIDALDEDFGSFSTDFESLLDAFETDHGSVYDASTLRTTITLLEALKARARVPYVDRVRYQALADHRKRTKTPPGFEDPKDGDFFVWADFLLGLHLAKSSGEIFSGSVLVTNDKKVDWVREGIPHPVLTAEAVVVSDVPFSIWSLDQLAEKIASVT